MTESIYNKIKQSLQAAEVFNPAFFPFQLPVTTGDFISQHGDRIDVVRYGLVEIEGQLN